MLAARVEVNSVNVMVGALTAEQPQFWKTHHPETYAELLAVFDGVGWGDRDSSHKLLLAESRMPADLQTRIVYGKDGAPVATTDRSLPETPAP